MKDINNLPLDLTGTPSQNAYLTNPLRALAQDINLCRAMSQGRKCAAWFAPPTDRRPRLVLTWAPTDLPPGQDWEPYYLFRSDLSAEQNETRMRYALTSEPILLKGEQTPVDYCEAVY